MTKAEVEMQDDQEKVVLHFELTNVPEHGYQQEFGRAPEDKASAWTMVPVASAFGHAVSANKAPKGPDIFWAPSDKGKGQGAKNFFKDKQGHLFKAIFQRTRSTKGIAKARRDWRKAPLAAKVGRRPSREKVMMEKEAKLLYIVYPNFVPGIPGMSKGKFAKKPPALSSDLVQKFGFSSRKGFEASRWATRTVIKLNKGLVDELRLKINDDVKAGIEEGLRKSGGEARGKAFFLGRIVST